MKYACKTIIVLCLPLVLLACESKSKPTFDDVKQKTQEAADTAAQFAKNQLLQAKDDAVKASEERLHVMDQKIDALKGQVDKQTGKARGELQTQIEALQARRAQLEKDLDALKRDGTEKWQDTLRKLSEAGDAFDTSYEDLKKKLKTL